MRDRLVIADTLGSHVIADPSDRLATFFWPMTRDEQRAFLSARFPEFLNDRSKFVALAHEFALAAKLSFGEQRLSYELLGNTALSMASEN